MKVRETLCDICGKELPQITHVVGRPFPSSRRISVKIKRHIDEIHVGESRVEKLDLCGDCMIRVVSTIKEMIQEDE